jgi:hypothetical protein
VQGTLRDKAAQRPLTLNYKGFPSKVKREIRDGFSLSYS